MTWYSEPNREEVEVALAQIITRPYSAKSQTGPREDSPACTPLTLNQVRPVPRIPKTTNPPFAHDL